MAPALLGLAHLAIFLLGLVIEIDGLKIIVPDVVNADRDFKVTFTRDVNETFYPESRWTYYSVYLDISATHGDRDEYDQKNPLCLLANGSMTNDQEVTVKVPADVGPIDTYSIAVQQ
jgi:hypothetical protein